MESLLKNYWPVLLLGSIGLLLAILLVTIGLFKTLLLLFITGLSAYFGLYLKRAGVFDKYIKK